MPSDCTHDCYEPKEQSLAQYGFSRAYKPGDVSIPSQARVGLYDQKRKHRLQGESNTPDGTTGCWVQVRREKAKSEKAKGEEVQFSEGEVLRTKKLFRLDG